MTQVVHEHRPRGASPSSSTSEDAHLGADRALLPPRRLAGDAAKRSCLLREGASGRDAPPDSPLAREAQDDEPGALQGDPSLPAEGHGGGVLAAAHASSVNATSST